jgi:peptide/nickel transport system permease protein
MGTSLAHGDPVSSMIGRVVAVVQLLFWGDHRVRSPSPYAGVYSAMKRYSIGDYFFTGLSYAGIAMPDFWFALWRSRAGDGADRLVHLDQPDLLFDRAALRGVSGVNHDYFLRVISRCRC